MRRQSAHLRRAQRASGTRGRSDRPGACQPDMGRMDPPESLGGRHVQAQNTDAEHLAYIRRRMMEVDITSSDLDGLDMSSPAFQIAMRHGMATAFHEMEHRLLERVEDAAQPA